MTREEERVIGVGLIGSGFIGDTYADALQDVRDAELVATCAEAADCFARGETPQETFEDGLVVNRVLGACCAAMRSGTWEKVQVPA